MAEVAGGVHEGEVADGGVVDAGEDAGEHEFEAALEVGVVGEQLLECLEQVDVGTREDLDAWELAAEQLAQMPYPLLAEAEFGV